MQPLSGASQSALAQILDAEERIDQIAPAVGSSLVLTDRRLILVREGANFRPKTGIRSFAIDLYLHVRLGPSRKRLMIEAAGKTINVFVRPDQVDDAETLLAEVRRRIYGNRGDQESSLRRL
jgi:hypothetical protein